MASWEEVVTFLRDCKSAARAGLYHFVPRHKNIQGLICLGLTDGKETVAWILALTPEDYCRGPEEDRDFPDEEVWVFGMEIGGKEAYIKLKLMEDGRTGVGYRLKVLAFHPAEAPLSFPLRGGEA